MNERSSKIKNLLTVSVFGLILAGGALLGWLLPDAQYSLSERRALEQLPELTAKNVFSGGFSSDLEDYMLDQVPARDAMRTVDAAMRYGLLAHADVGGIYLTDGSAVKIEYPLDETQVLRAAAKINEARALFPDDARVYWAVIPDKNYYCAADKGCPSIDYDRMTALVSGALGDGARYVDLVGQLELGDYYLTDSHWRQERLIDVAQTLADAMGASVDGAESYEQRVLYPFSGVYRGQSALPLAPETLTFMTSDVTDAAVVTLLGREGTTGVYDETLFGGTDGYDVFLSGAQSIVTIDNPLAENDRSLVVFRDSYGSSLAPLLLSGYARVTLVDLRYIPTALVGDYIGTENADVLFIYSTTILNSGGLLR